MRPGFTNQTEHELVFSRANEMRLQRIARAMGISETDLIQQGVIALMDAGVLPPEKEGRVIAFEGLKSRLRGPPSSS